MRFEKYFKTPDPIPPQGIAQVVKLLETGLLYRYNFDANVHTEAERTVLDGELASEVAQLEYDFSQYIDYPYVIAVNSCGSALFLSLKAAGVQHNDKVLCNAFTFSAVPSSIVH
jgi:dTDP-4-amino-4,6-dideoxygalactose transaminase